MVVLVVIGVLATIALPDFRSSFEISRGREAETTLRMIYEAERAYYFSKAFPDRTYTQDNTFGDLLLYLQSPPASANWSYSLGSTDIKNNFTATATRVAGAYRAGTTRTIDQDGTLGGTWSP